MQIDTSPHLQTSTNWRTSTSWEPCVAFSSDEAGSEVCAGCGWLTGEHERDAVIHSLPARNPRLRHPSANRLAS